MNCTWKDCSKKGRHKHRDIDKSVFGHLCDEHSRMMSQAIESGSPREIFKCYTSARGYTAPEPRGIPCPDPTAGLPPGEVVRVARGARGRAKKA